ncbi:uncharacterized protein LOC131294670 [Anopheles ziemanni]|uniref:uncharacterized protein LOC131265263 n=1 Tax=Anopheles coustani TaxID=139045 RepID=UPI002658D1E3|nr:uncharacterized protein LOC131265263 [Anopheles coustani]XP_058178697.1 uncharacterized protein LOC131294670 [Anopheles ziemanni]
MSLFKQLLLVAAMMALAVAEELAETSTGKSVEEGRRRKRFFKFLTHAIGPIMSTLTTVLLVKAKIVLVALFFAGIYFFGHKIFPGGFFGSSIISETPPPFIDSSPYTSYHSDHEIISSYPGPEPFSSYGPPSSSSSSGTPYNSYLPPASGSGSYSSYSKYSGGSRRKRAIVDDRQASGSDALDNGGDLEENEMYWTDSLTDITFRFLGVNRRVCRKRFVCEFDFQARRNPILLFVTRAIGRDIFHNYRDETDEKANSYKDCGRIYEECKVPKRKKFARRPFGPLPMAVPPMQKRPEAIPDASLDAQENEVVPLDADTITTTLPTDSLARGKLILQKPTRANRFRRN